MLLEARQISKTYGQREVLSGVNIVLERGQLVAYLGTNGAGKSTTVGILTGLIRETSGQVVRMPGLKMGMVFQKSILDEELTVAANLRSRLGLYEEVDRAWFERLVDLFELVELLNKPYGRLSGGQKRRVDIARALLSQPNLLFLDEPTTGLDIQTRQTVWRILEQLRQEGLTIFLTTHYLEEAEQADKIYILQQGRVLATGSSQELLMQHGKNRLHLTGVGLMNQTIPGAQVINETSLVIDGIDTATGLDLLSRYQADITDFDYQKADLNQVFLAITGQDLANMTETERH